jgi:hypothetical protein
VPRTRGDRLIKIRTSVATGTPVADWSSISRLNIKNITDLRCECMRLS